MIRTLKAWNARHRLTVAGLAAAALSLPASGLLARAPAVGADATEKLERPMVIAHRGGALLRPENTMPAFRHAVELGTDILEFDMEMTADDKIAVYHDAAINPRFCTPDAGSGVVPGPVRAMTLDDIRKLDCGSGVRPMYDGKGHVRAPGARVPTLDEVLSAFAASDVHFFAETKVPKGSDVDPVKFATLLNAAVQKYDLEDRLILQSFDFRTIDALHRINPNITTCLLGAQRLTQDFLALLRAHHASCIVLKSDGLGRDQVRDLQKAGVLVYSDVVDTPDRWKEYADLGVDAIFTNDPAGLKDYLDEASHASR
jgi:glycerophosphoryl diester phosphodiesterase